MFTSPGWPQPGPFNTVGAPFLPGWATGNQCARILVPSNDVTSESLVEPATGVACTVGAVRGGHAGRV